MAFMVTGCPHNDYTVELKPQGKVMERTVTFYQADGADTNGIPNYQAFNAEELAVIAALYPTNGLTVAGERHTVRGEFTNTMPGDVGGAGVYTNLATSLGEAGFYVERFRGNDDIAGLVETRLNAAGQVADWMVGWSQSALGREPGYARLHQFLDVDFRRDLKNVSAYYSAGQLAGEYSTNAAEEFAVRFGQYLEERGYFKLGEVPNLFREMSGNDSSALLRRLPRLVAGKMGVPETEPVPAALAFLADETMMENSFSNYLAGTDAYQASLRQWEADRKLNPDAKRPDPWDAAGQTGNSLLLGFNLFGGTPDHLAVKLSLSAAPIHGNGRWDAAAKQEVWESDIPCRTNLTALPVSCYASWVQADEAFQTAHLGKVALGGDDLTGYCLWRCSLDAKRGEAWDAFLTGLEPGTGLMKQLDAFRFSDESDQAGTNNQQTISMTSKYARELLQGVLK